MYVKSVAIISDLYSVPTRFYESVYEQNRMCELYARFIQNLVTVFLFSLIVFVSKPILRIRRISKAS